MNKIEELEHQIKVLDQKKKELEVHLEETIRETVKIALESAKEQKIKRISKNIIIVKYSQLMGNPWNPSFYEWEASAKMLFDYLSKLHPNKWRSELQTLYDKRNGNRVDLPFKQMVWFNSYRTEKKPIPAEFVKRIIDKL